MPHRDRVRSDGVLRGTVNLTEQFIALPLSRATPTARAPRRLVRVLPGLQRRPPIRPMPPPISRRAEADRAGADAAGELGDLVQLTFINQVNPNASIATSTSTPAPGRRQNGGDLSLADVDTYPNCLHASSTANIHFHGTHTSPNTTGDNVFLEIRPLPRDNQGDPTVQPGAVTRRSTTSSIMCARQLAATR